MKLFVNNFNIRTGTKGSSGYHDVLAITIETNTDVLLTTGFVECQRVGRVWGFEITGTQQVFAGHYVETDNTLKFQKIGEKVHGYSYHLFR